MSAIAERLAELGHELPPVAAPAGAYVPALVTGNLVQTSGQLPTTAGVLAATGKVGADVTPEEAAGYARIAVLNALAAAGNAIGSLDRVTRVVKVNVFIASAPDFTQQAIVANGASDLLLDVFGEAGKHARASLGVAVLPLDAPVEIEITLEFA